MLYAGIDIGSTCTKAAVMNASGELLYNAVLPTGWDSVGTAHSIKQALEDSFPEREFTFVATGYGRVAVPYAHKTVTEITCHGKGASYIFGERSCTVIDIGGQDTKIILLNNGQVKDFHMNDKCSAGTGRFLEIMANTLGVRVEELCDLARQGGGVTISSMCTVFAESEVISLIGQGTAKADIAHGVVESITSKVYQQALKLAGGTSEVFLTGGLCELPYILESLSAKLGKPVVSGPMGRYAGAIGAAIMAKN